MDDKELVLYMVQRTHPCLSLHLLMCEVKGRDRVIILPPPPKKICLQQHEFVSPFTLITFWVTCYLTWYCCWTVIF